MHAQCLIPEQAADEKSRLYEKREAENLQRESEEFLAEEMEALQEELQAHRGTASRDAALPREGRTREVAGERDRRGSRGRRGHIVLGQQSASRDAAAWRGLQRA